MDEIARRAQLRAADADRDRAADVLRRAAAEGRLVTEELEERLEQALSARTYGQLDALLADLPGPGLRDPLPRLRRRSPLALIGTAVGFVLAVSIVSVLVLAVVLQLLFGVIAAWWIWVAAGWLLFARRRGGRWRSYGRYGCGPARRVHVHRSYWA